MKHARSAQPRHAKEPASRLASDAEILPMDARYPGNDFLLREIENDRKGEHWLVLKSIIAVAAVAVLVALRELFFS